MRKQNDLFIVLTPLHVYIVKVLIIHLKIKNFKIMTTAKYMKYFNKDNVLEINIGELHENKINKINKLIILNFTIKKGIYEKVYIPSDANPYIQTILKKIIFEELNYFEEGGTLLYRVNELVNNTSQAKNMLIKRLLGLANIDNVLKDKRIVNAYTFFPDALSKLVPNINFIGLESLMNIYDIDIKYPIVNNKYLKPDVLIFTQPLTKDGYCKNNEEIVIIEKFIVENIDKKILIKLHPRDDIDEYKYLLKYDILFLPEDYKEIPYQVLHNIIKPYSIISYFSSVLFSVSSITDNFQRMSLINSIKDDKIKGVVYKMSEYFEDLNILDVEFRGDK